jgi:murein DD-endopeptidase MepM/ murein hydrolase activator NlpD
LVNRIIGTWEVTSANGVAGAAGNYIKVMHGNGFESSYSHTDSSLTIGTQISQGQVVGITDDSGASTGSHLHFLLRDQNGNRIDLDPVTDFV